jgi:hypothetical protein
MAAGDRGMAESDRISTLPAVVMVLGCLLVHMKYRAAVIPSNSMEVKM